MTRLARYSRLSPALCALLTAAACTEPEATPEGTVSSDAAATTDAGISPNSSGADSVNPTSDHASEGDATTPRPGASGPNTTPGTRPNADAGAEPPEDDTRDPSTDPGTDGGTQPGNDAGPTDGTPTDPALNAGEYSVQAFSFEDTQPLGFNPLGKERFNLLLLEETALIISGAGGSILTDDAQHEHAESPLSPSLTPVNTLAVWSGSGNLDTDGHAELVVISHDASNVHVVIGDNDGTNALSQSHTFTIPNGGANAGAIQAAIADFDGDGKDEIAIAAAGPNGWLRIYDDSDAQFALIKDTALGQDQSAVELAAGNFDADAAAELAVLRIGTGTDDIDLSVLDDVPHDLAELHAWPQASLLPSANQGAQGATWLSGGILRAGNIDTDAADELYLLLSQTETGEGGGGQIVTGKVFDDVTNTANVVATPKVSQLSYPTGSLARPFDATFADMDGDGVDELYLLHLESSVPNFAWKLSQWNPSADQYDWSTQADYTTLDTNYNDSSFGRLGVVDGDGLVGESIVVALKNSGASFPVKTYRIQGQPVVSANDQHTSFALQIPAAVTTPNSYPSTSVPLIAGGDFDNDSLQVKYTGDNWLSLSSPRPIVVMAAPPVKEGISQNTDGSSTAFGQEVSQGGTATHEVSTTYSTTLSFESSGLTGLFGTLGSVAGGSVSKTLSDAFASTNTETTLQTIGTSFTGAYPDDCIVFQGVLYTSYAYEVTRASDPAVIGKRMTVDVPVAVKTYKWTLNYYNQMLAPGDVAIGTETLSHVVGDPTTYPSAKLRDQVLANATGWKSNQVSVGQGNGDNKVRIDLSQQTTQGGSTTIATEDSWGVAIAGAGYDSSHAVSETGAYEVIVGSATNYEGTVGDISTPADYSKYSYDFGMFVYEFAHPSGPHFQVINYWTSNFGPAL